MAVCAVKDCPANLDVITDKTPEYRSIIHRPTEGQYPSGEGQCPSGYRYEIRELLARQGIHHGSCYAPAVQDVVAG